MIKHFGLHKCGGKIVTEPINGPDEREHPSPNQLKGKILLKFEPLKTRTGMDDLIHYVMKDKSFKGKFATKSTSNFHACTSYS